MTGFYTIVKDAQFTSILTTTGVPPGTNTVINNASGDVETYGAEVQAAWLINDLFSIVATYGYQDNKVDKFETSSEVLPFLRAGRRASTDVRRPVPIGHARRRRNWVGHRSTTIPCRGSTPQNFGPYNVSLSVVGHGQDDMILVGGATAAAVVTQKAYSLVDMRAALQWNMEDDHTLRLSLIGKNLNDKEYLTEALPLGNGGFEGWGSPRTWALELLYQIVEHSSLSMKAGS